MKWNKVILAKFIDGMGNDLYELFLPESINNVKSYAEKHNLTYISVQDLYINDADYQREFCN